MADLTSKAAEDDNTTSETGSHFYVPDFRTEKHSFSLSIS